MLPVSTLFAFIVIIYIRRTSAKMQPTTPGPHESYTAGLNCTIAWDVDTSNSWTNVTIDLMSGSNNNMSLITNVVSGLDGTDESLTPYSWTCPEVDPYSNIYFYQFTNGDDALTRTWTTRFTITSPLNETEFPENPTQPDGEDVPWGTGHLVSIKSITSASTSQSATGQTSASPSTTMASGRKKPHGPKPDDADESAQSNSAEEGDEHGSSTGSPTPATRPGKSAVAKSSTAVTQTHSTSVTATSSDEDEESGETFSSSNKGGPSSSYPSDGEEAQSQSSFSDSLPGFPEYKNSGAADAADSAKAMGCHCEIGTDRENGAKGTTQMEFSGVISSVTLSVIIALVALFL